MLGRCLVTGGGGYLGRNLARALLARGLQVRLFDQRFGDRVPEEAEAIVGDVRDREAVARACEGIDTVFHCAAIINTTTFARSAVRKLVDDVNVGGTRNIIDSCQERGIARLVFTSSISVVVDRDPVPDVEGDAPYASHPPLDLYTASKIAAERLVLAADSEELHTVALRPGGIYGPGEEHHLPRVVREVLSGRFVAKVGPGTAKADNVFIDDLVDAHLRAADRLGDGVVDGRAYGLGDGHPTSYFDFFRPIVEALGRPFPTRSVPAFLVAIGAYFAELLYSCGGPFPFMTRMEVRKLNMDHWSSLEEATRDLGWRPAVDPLEGMRRSMTWVRHLEGMLQLVKRPHAIWWFAVIGGLSPLFALAFSGGAYEWWVGELSPMFPRWLLQVIAGSAIALHVGEALYARTIATRAGLETAGGWFRQTMLLGYPSLRLLLRELEKQDGLAGQATGKT